MLNQINRERLIFYFVHNNMCCSNTHKRHFKLLITQLSKRLLQLEWQKIQATLY